MLAMQFEVHFKTLGNMKFNYIMNMSFRESEENYEGSGGGCSDKAYIQTQTKFQACSHTVSKDVYQQFQGVEGIHLSKRGGGALDCLLH